MDMSEQESFWDAGSFTVVTDKTKPAMKLTIEELTSRGKKVYVVDMSDNPDEGTLRKVSELPSGVEGAVIGLTKTNPAEVIEGLKEKGVGKIWIHWRTETPEASRRCAQSQMQCITGRCPMIYLSRGLNVHTLHAGVAKMLGKY